jgi:acyl-CoA synthetase (AMP-forming)/AMP-acid ligase II
MKKNILEFFYNTVEKNQSKIAAIEFDKTITFCDLDKRAQILANTILVKKSISNMPIAVYLPKSIDSVVADIAITYSCNIYMNIDVKSPHERIKNIFDLIKPEIVITNSANLKFLNGSIENNKILLIDEVNFNQESDRSLLLSRIELQIDTDPLCIINTSGSTGTPKGVVLNHRSFI